MNNPTMFGISSMGNTTNHLSFCVGQSSRKTNRERPVNPFFHQISHLSSIQYVSRPFWPYQYEHHLNASTRIPPNTQIREISPIRLSPSVRHLSFIFSTFSIDCLSEPSHNFTISTNAYYQKTLRQSLFIGDFVLCHFRCISFLFQYSIYIFDRNIF